MFPRGHANAFPKDSSMDVPLIFAYILTVTLWPKVTVVTAEELSTSHYHASAVPYLRSLWGSYTIYMLRMLV